MSESYCGKSCETCMDKEALSCPGCKEGPGRFHSDECGIASCARAKGSHCMECGALGECSKFRGRNRIAQQRLWDRQSRESEQQYDNAVDAYLKPRLPVMETWFRRLFKADLIYVAAAIFSLGFLDDRIPVLRWIQTAAFDGALVALGVCYLKMADLSRKHYAAAGISALILLAIRCAAFFLEGGDRLVRIAVLMLGYAVELVQMLCLCRGNASILELVDEDLSRDWDRLLRWFMLVCALQIVSWFLVSKMVGLALYVDMIAKLPYYGVLVLRVAYLYKSRKACWEYRTYE